MTNEELLQQIRNEEGDDHTLATLWEQVCRLFYMHSDGLYHRHKGRADSCGVERDDCRQVCWFAFLDAIKAYNGKPDNELMFSTYAKYHVRRRVYELLGYRTSKREPLNGAVSLDAPLPGNEDEKITIGDTIADSSAEAPFEDIDCSDTAAEVLERVSALPTKQAAAVRGRFWQDKTLTEVGAELGLTPKQIHNQYQAAIGKLRRDKRLQEIRDDYYANTTLTKHTGFQFFKENGMSSVEWHLLKLEERLERAKGGDERDGVQ
ncbi:MAG TPA: sigma-70 family RNA polymerase sigma factor [Paludibacteraceae bacterium]|nr:sigma-70 family RNA polymerase sigma factor [Paludibacteraceae bacterium]